MKIKISQAELSCCELIFCLEFWWRYKMILSDKSLKELMVNKELLITPYSEEQLGQQVLICTWGIRLLSILVSVLI